jgi:Methyltransferase domain
MKLSDADAHSPYLVGRLLTRSDENIFNHVKFRLVAKVLCERGPPRPKVLDLGCGNQLAQRYLTRLGVDMNYFGVDYEAMLGPDLVSDLRAPDAIAERLPWRPDVILLLDVLEHLDGREEDIRGVLALASCLLPPGGLVVVTLPQLYRLDRFKLPHLHYPEHKIRLRQDEWAALLAQKVCVEHVHGLGYVSMLPYLLMAHRGYRDDNNLGRAFRFLRERVIEGDRLRRLDLALTLGLGAAPSLRTWSNDVLFVCRTPASPGRRS